eukprot:COSAG04_NODE_20972_length_382_cov_0.908127_1_plen_54_part_10
MPRRQQKDKRRQQKDEQATQESAVGTPAVFQSRDDTAKAGDKLYTGTDKSEYFS